MVSSVVSLLDILFEGVSSSSMKELPVLKYFSIDCDAPKALIIMQVNWSKPHYGWIKCSSDDVSRDYPGLSTI